MNRPAVIDSGVANLASVVSALEATGGNPFRRDDGIGPAVIQRLRTEHALEGVDLLDGGTLEMKTR